MRLNPYEDDEIVSREVAAGRHREAVGGLWDELGSMQLDFLVAEGLRPGMTLVDVGCGCLRGGIQFVDYLEPGHYFGVDSNQALLDAGYEVELAAAGLQDRLPKQNLLCTADFELGAFGRRFDMAIAQSVFTHLPLNHVRLCLERLAPHLVEGGKLYATFFECPEGHPTGEPLDHEPGGIRTFGASDPYHYRVSDLVFACCGLPWEARYVGDWQHPRAQKMMCFVRGRG